MVDLTGALLIRRTRITVEYLRPQIRPCLTVFNFLRIGKLTSVIRKDNRKQSVKQFRPKHLVQCIDDTDDGTRGVGIPQERQHEPGLDEMDGEQAFAADPPDDAVHLDDRRFRIIRKELLEIRIVPPGPAPPVHLELRLFITRAVPGLAGQVDVPDIKELGVDVIIQGLLAAHQVIHMMQVDLMQGLSIPHKGADDPVDPCDVILA